MRSDHFCITLGRNGAPCNLYAKGQEYCTTYFLHVGFVLSFSILLFGSVVFSFILMPSKSNIDHHLLRHVASKQPQANSRGRKLPT